MTLSWLPVSTMKSNGPNWLIFTGTMSSAPATRRGCRPAMFPGQCASARLEMDVMGNPVERRTQNDTWSSGDFTSTSARGVRAKATLAAISGYLNRSEIKCVSTLYGKDVDWHNYWPLLNLNS